MEIQSDDVHKATRGILEPADLIKAGIMRKGRAKRRRTYEVKHPVKRHKDLCDWILGKNRIGADYHSIFYLGLRN